MIVIITTALFSGHGSVEHVHAERYNLALASNKAPACVHPQFGQDICCMHLVSTYLVDPAGTQH